MNFPLVKSQGPVCDLSGDGNYDLDNLSHLYDAVGSGDLQSKLDGFGIVHNDDFTVWLAALVRSTERNLFVAMATSMAR